MKLIGEQVRMTIELGNYSPADRRELIESFRRWIAEERQSGWDAFNQRREQFHVGPRTSLVASLLLAAFFCGFAVLSVVLAGRGFLAGPQLVAITVVNVAGLALCLWMAWREWGRLRRGERGATDERLPLTADSSESAS